jgi:hypothetical protein
MAGVNIETKTLVQLIAITGTEEGLMGSFAEGFRTYRRP